MVKVQKTTDALWDGII